MMKADNMKEESFESARTLQEVDDNWQNLMEKMSEAAQAGLFRLEVQVPFENNQDKHITNRLIDWLVVDNFKVSDVYKRADKNYIMVNWR